MALAKQCFSLNSAILDIRGFGSVNPIRIYVKSPRIGVLNARSIEFHSTSRLHRHESLDNLQKIQLQFVLKIDPHIKDYRVQVEFLF